MSYNPENKDNYFHSHFLLFILTYSFRNHLSGQYWGWKFTENILKVPTFPVPQKNVMKTSHTLWKYPLKRTSDFLMLSGSIGSVYNIFLRDWKVGFHVGFQYFQFKWVFINIFLSIVKHYRRKLRLGGLIICLLHY